MEKIEIREKITPYSHQSGVLCQVPLSDWVIQVYPALIKVHEFKFPIGITGPVKDFTVQMDLERDCVWIWGIGKEGAFRLKISADSFGLSLFVDRAPKGGISVGGHLLERKGKLGLAKGGKFIENESSERLSLGNWKAQDWDLVRRRGEFSEIAPVLFMLGQKIPSDNAPLIRQSDHFLLAALSGICAPLHQDAMNQGLPPFEGSSLDLIRGAYLTIRSYLIDGNVILPIVKWPAGKVVGLETEYGTIDLEWTKGHIRRMIFVPANSEEMNFIFGKEISSCRCNGSRLLNGDSFPAVANKKYLFDRFQK